MGTLSDTRYTTLRRTGFQEPLTYGPLEYSNYAHDRTTDRSGANEAIPTAKKVGIKVCFYHKRRLGHVQNDRLLE